MNHSSHSVNRILLLPLLLLLAALPLRAQETGVLIMAHGGSEEWNSQVVQAAEPLQENYPVEFAWGMANYVTLQRGIDRLEEQGVSRIVAVPLFISSYSPIIRQTEYLMGLRDSLADRPMPLMHHSEEYVEMTGAQVDSSDYMRDMLMPPDLQQLDIDAEIIMTEALDNHDVVAEILHERISALSSNPARDTAVLVGHGPNSSDDNRRWVKNLESLARKIQDLQTRNGEKYKQIFALTVRDDAPEQVFNQARQQFRALVRQAGLFGEVIVVPVFLSSGGREDAVAERLEGLDFKWSGRTLLPDPRLTDFLQNTVEQALSQDSE